MTNISADYMDKMEPLTENEVRYQNAALADENKRLRAVLKDARPYVESCLDDALTNPAADVLKKIDETLT